MIMEYLPFVTLKEAVYSTEHMRHIYERVEQIDTELTSHLLHHNDLHRGNIMVSDNKSNGNKSPKTVGDKSPSAIGNKSPKTVGNKSPSAIGNKSPYPEIVIFDFGEASLGPTKPIFQRGIK
jgi:predicted unusual protein kinase regulating ubiquinone biosynthesis (AarF/ABC1/UbiB family)